MKRLLEISVIFAVLFSTGCMTPESVKRSAVMAEKAIETAQTKVSKEHDAQVDLAAAKDSAGAVAYFLGKPDAPVVYTPEGAHALASEARMAALFQKTMESFATKIVGQITGKIPKPNGPQRFPIEEIMAAFAAVYGTFKGAGYAAKKIKEKRKKASA